MVPGTQERLPGTSISRSSQDAHKKRNESARASLCAIRACGLQMARLQPALCSSAPARVLPSVALQAKDNKAPPR